MDVLLRKVWCLLLVSLAGFCLFFTNSLIFRYRSGIISEEIRVLEGVVSGDSRKLSSGGVFFQLGLVKTGDALGNMTAAAGLVSVIVRTGESTGYLKGDHVIIEDIRLVENNSGGQSLLFTGKGNIFRYSGSVLTETARTARQKALACIIRLMGKDGCWQPLFIAMSTGYQDDLTPEIKEAFTRTGCSHLLALSGFNLGIITGLFGFFLSRFISGGRWYLLIIPLLAAYLWVTGLPPSLTRAFLFFLVLKIFNHSPVAKNRESLIILLITLVLQAVFFPLDLLTLSCRISYLAMGGLLAFSSTFNRFFRLCIPKFLSEILAVTLSAQLTVIPYIQFIFGKTTAWGLLLGPSLQLLVLVFFQTGFAHTAAAMIPGSFPDMISNRIQNCLYTGIRFLLVEPVALLEKYGLRLEYTSWGSCFFLLIVILIPLAGWIIHLLSNRSITALPKPYGNCLIPGDWP